MRVIDILKLSLKFLDKEDLATKLADGETLDESEEGLVVELENSFNLIHQEISSLAVPIVKVEKLKTENFKIPFTQFSFSPTAILAVKDGYGRGVKYKVFADYLVALAGDVEVWYSVCPEVLSSQDEFSSILPERVFAYGIAREFFIKKGLYSDAQVWEERFKSSLELLSPKKSSVRIAGRRWL